MNMKIYEGYGSSPLKWVAVSGELVMFKMLFRHPEIDLEHINHENTSEGMTALGYAAKRGDNAIVKALLDAHADVNISNDLKHDPLKTAVYFGRLDTMKLLLGVPGVDFRTPGHRGATALQEAAARGHEKIVRLILNKDADPNTRSGNKSVSMSAVKSEKTSIVTMLMAAGARS
jgi:ankyrin repeat protein